MIQLTEYAVALFSWTGFKFRELVIKNKMYPLRQQKTMTNLILKPEEQKNSAMKEFYQLYQELLVITLVLTAVIFTAVWIAYSLNMALNYLLGACAGVLYLKMLARDVERLGTEKQQLSKTRLALLVVLILLASRWNQLQIMPIFLGFLTYKATLIIYVIRMAFVLWLYKAAGTLKSSASPVRWKKRPH